MNKITLYWKVYSESKKRIQMSDSYGFYDLFLNGSRCIYLIELENCKLDIKHTNKRLWRYF